MKINRLLNIIPFIVIAFLIVAAYGCVHAAENPCLKQMREQSANSMPALGESEYDSRNMGKVDEKVSASLYRKGEFSVNPFASARVQDSEAEFGGGLALGYAITDRLTIEADAITE